MTCIALPLADVDLPTIFTVVVVVAVFIGRILMSIRQAAPGPKPPGPRPAQPRPKPPAGRDPVVDEIAEFLRRASQRSAEAQSRRAGPGGQRARPAEVRSPSPPPPPRREEPVDAVLVEADGGVAQHVRDTMGKSQFRPLSPQVEGEVAQADEKLESHLHQVFDHQLGGLSNISGETTTASTVVEASAPGDRISTVPGAAASDLAALFANAETVRQAVLVQEILQRPEQRWNR